MEDLLTDNDPELNGKYLGTITSDFVKVADNLKEASFQIRQRNISQYPVFPMSKTTMQVGKLLFGKEEMGTNWHYYASMLEEFVQRKLVDEDKREAFEQAYKNPDEYCCLFVVEPDFIRFIYLPYPEDDLNG